MIFYFAPYCCLQSSFTLNAWSKYIVHVLWNCDVQQTFVDQLAMFYYLLNRIKSHQSPKSHKPLLADCLRSKKQSKRLQRLVMNLMARRHMSGLCPIIGQLERIGGPGVPSQVVPHLRQPRFVPDISTRVTICNQTLNVTRELCGLLSCMHKFYKRCSFWNIHGRISAVSQPRELFATNRPLVLQPMCFVINLYIMIVVTFLVIADTS